MGIFEWMYKNDEDKQVTTKEQENAINNLISQEDEDAKRRKIAFEKLTRGENPIAKDEPQHNMTMTTNETAQGSQEVSVFNIKTNQDLEVVVDYVTRGEPVIANLGKVPKKEQQRAQDFLSGVVFALNANISLLVQDMYLITPYGIVIDKK